MAEAFIYDAVRTPRGRGKKKGALHEVRPIDLLRGLFCAIESRHHLNTQRVDDVVLGCVTPIGEQGANIARTAVLYSGWPMSVPGVTLNRFCASGLESVNLAAAKVASGMDQLVVAGGVESMSRWPMGSDGGAIFMDPLVNGDQGFVPQGISADVIASLEGYTREELDQFAMLSHQKAHTATEAGHFAKSIIPVQDINGLTLLAQDETIRADASLNSMSQLEPSFAGMGEMGFDATALSKYPTVGQIRHVHHAGNSSGIVDGAALILVGSRQMGQELNMKPRAVIRSWAVVGSEPTIMLTGPAPASRKALELAGMETSDIDLFEINEAFAAVVLKAVADLRLNRDQVNVNGGAIAMGHPLGATGAVILGTLLDELERRDLTTGLATLCVGAGMGIATIIERV